MGLAQVAGLLACPHCGAGLELHERALRCANGHSHDVAKQGYVSLLPAGAQTGTADTAEMVGARSAFLAAGHYAGLADAITAAVTGTAIADVGAGTGYYLARILDARPEAVGVALDVSKFALRRAARAHDRIGAVVADAWRALPLRDASVDVALNVFAPRNSAELRRILRPDGALIVVTPASEHLAELVTRLSQQGVNLLSVESEKDARLRDQLGGEFALESAQPYREVMALPAADALALVLMGPSAWHVDRDAVENALREPLNVTLATTVSVFRPRGSAPAAAPPAPDQRSAAASSPRRGSSRR